MIGFDLRLVGGRAERNPLGPIGQQDDLLGVHVLGGGSRNTHRESLEKDETLDDAFHGVSGEAEGAGEVAPLAADGGGGDASP